MKLFLLFIILLIGATNGQFHPECPEYESFNQCGTACEPSCERPHPTFCTLQCVIGCQCDRGYLRRSDKKCVLPDQCQQICPPNEYWDSCHNSCPEAKCPSNGQPDHPCDPIPCVSGCLCQNGYVRNSDGQCVLPDLCPQNCPPNEYWIECYDPCHDRRCPGQLNPPCMGKPCFPGSGGCGCQNGYVRNSEGRCVDESECPQTCPTNEYWDLCHNSCTEKKCPVENAPPNICPLFCTEGCSCQDGYVRNEQGQCVRDWECPPIVPPTPPPLSCANFRCRRGQHCYMVYPAGCLICPPHPQCLAVNPCRFKRCRRGEYCVLEQVFCIRAPCNPIAECRPRRIFPDREPHQNGTTEAPPEDTQ